MLSLWFDAAPPSVRRRFGRSTYYAAGPPLPLPPPLHESPHESESEWAARALAGSLSVRAWRIQTVAGHRGAAGELATVWPCAVTTERLTFLTQIEHRTLCTYRTWIRF